MSGPESCCIQRAPHMNNLLSCSFGESRGGVHVSAPRHFGMDLRRRRWNSKKEPSVISAGSILWQDMFQVTKVRIKPSGLKRLHLDRLPCKSTCLYPAKLTEFQRSVLVWLAFLSRKRTRTRHLLKTEARSNQDLALIGYRNVCMLDQAESWFVLPWTSFANQILFMSDGRQCGVCPQYHWLAGVERLRVTSRGIV